MSFPTETVICRQEDIIPSDLREKVEAEERQKEMEDLYLPPRSRKTVQVRDALKAVGCLFFDSFAGVERAPTKNELAP